MEKDALLKLDNKPLSDGFTKLTEENTRTPLYGLKAAIYEAYKQAILKHPDFQGTMLQRELQKESIKTATAKTSSFEQRRHINENEQKATPLEQPKIKFCRRCGSELKPENDCCPRCGTPIVEEKQKL